MSTSRAVYLDYNATTPVDKRVLAAMLPHFAEQFGNASSRDHAFGWDAADAVEEARGHVAAVVGAVPDEVIFTGSATESINSGLRGLVGIPRVAQAITCTTEHEAVLETCSLISTSVPVDIVSANPGGRIDPIAVMRSCNNRETAFVSLMMANNELGTVQPVGRVADVTHAANAVMFSDLTQAVAKIPVDVRELGVDMAAFSAHKLYGPKGIGALFIRGREPKVNWNPLIVGGGHERGLRAGTLNVPGIVGFGEACRLARLEMQSESERVARLRDKLESGLVAQIASIWINGDATCRLPNTTNIGFKGLDARTLIRDMHDIACSTRAACSSGNRGPSHVLKAIGLSDEDAYSCIRFSLGRFTTEDEIDYTIEKVVTSVHKLRRLKSVRT